ncbi:MULTISPECIES: alanine dehydrogenase [Colwellia]|uniref:Alanine dehydrogenase n=1 Tax=Colwellia marinimaniae TaxID=1513592 RepID=A0ABQ0MWK7_9GAMM|nr:MULTISPECIES: alanine dehydrogenase [Colwellia]GAW96740.1 alanine dehydrogenase [Colwellia marinimaniae]
MPQTFSRYSSIALVKEIESPENPGGLEKRVALVPSDVGQLVSAGIKVYVEMGAGEGVGFSDEEYIKHNAIMQTAERIYKDKSLIIKFKGPALSSIEQMSAACTLFCMAHFNSYPDRAKLLKDSRINVIAMEDICESPKQDSDERILGRVAMNAALTPFFNDNTIGGLRVRIIGWSERLRGAINRCGNRSPRSLQVIQPSLAFEELEATGTNALYFYDSKSFKDPQGILQKLRALKTHTFDINDFEIKQGQQAITDYQASHPPAQFGLRRIQCLHETGQAGARYGMGLLADHKPSIKKANIKAVILGYGNVAQGALDELHQQGIRHIHVLGRAQTAKSRIDYWLKDADIIINGAEQSVELRGKNFLISNKHLKELIPENSVVIDLVGGSPTNRSPVEAVLSCSFLTAPYFVQDGVLVSSLWGWPMMGMMRETAIRYSGQIVEVLIGKEKLIEGLGKLSPGVKAALVCGPFSDTPKD